MTDAPLGEKDEDDEAVAAFTTPLVMISLILLTAPGEQGKETISLLIYEDITSRLTEDKSVVLTVNKLSSLSLDMQIQRSVPAWKEQKCSVNIKDISSNSTRFYY